VVLVARVFHLLTEAEPFSEYHGGAISRWVANVVRFDSDAFVLAPSTDNSWKFDRSHVLVVEGLSRFQCLRRRGGHHLPLVVSNCILRGILSHALRTLRVGDTVWIHNRPEFALALEPLIRRRGARLVLHLHNSHLVQWSEKITRRFSADIYVFVSRYLRDEALKKFKHLRRTEVLYNGADPQIFFPGSRRKHPGEVPVVLFASRLVPEKGLHVFLEAMALLQEKQIALQGVVVGGAGFGNSAPTEYVLEMQRRAPSNVLFEPYCSGIQLGARFRDADMFCLPSCWQEPLGMAALEAMATGLPVIVTDSGGLPEVLVRGGGIVVPRESASELAQALGSLATDQPYRQRLAQEAYASFQESFTWEEVRRNYRAIVNQQHVETADKLPFIQKGVFAS
jgi:spore coat protein SA